MPVRPRIDLKGQAMVFVTTTITDWLPVFRSKIAAEAVLSQFQETTDHFSVSVVGYVLMPSHLHALLGFPHVERLSRFMQSFKSLSSRRVKALNQNLMHGGLHRDGSFHLWQPRFDDLIITSENVFRTKLEYIHNNPVKAGLVVNAADWLYSSASDWQVGVKGLLSIDKDFQYLG